MDVTFSTNIEILSNFCFPDSILDLYNRLFNHRPFLKGEVTHFVKEFEKKRGDQGVQNLFETLEVTTELQSGQVEKLVNTCDEQIPTINANLLVAQSMCNKILDQAKNSELDQALESSHQAREKEWSQYLNDFQNKCEKIDDAYNQKEKDLRLHFQKLEKDLN